MTQNIDEVISIDSIINKTYSVLEINKNKQSSYKVLCLTGHVQGAGKEPEPAAVCGAGHGSGHHQAVLPCWWQWLKEDLPGQVSRATVPALRLVPVHPDHRLPHQDLCHHPNLSG